LVSVATLARGGRSYDAIDWSRPIALWLGNEGAGLDAELARVADERATIPMAAQVESLNVAVAAGILLFEAARQRGRCAR
jgi:TrmH family RNA methyltransferase